MRNTLVVLLIAVVLIIGIGFAATAMFTVIPAETEFIDETGQPIIITGVVYENVIEVPADGNNFLMVDVEEGRRIVIYEEGGLYPEDAQDEQCNKNPLMAQIAQTINTGDIVEVVGVLDEQGNIRVCSDPSHTITVIQPAETDTDEAQATRQVAGTVVDLISDCAFDGNCAYVIETDDGERVTVIWAEGMSLICQNDPFNGGDTDIQVGDTLEALGRVIDSDIISGCGDASYFITKTS